MKHHQTERKHWIWNNYNESVDSNFIHFPWNDDKGKELTYKYEKWGKIEQPSYIHLHLELKTKTGY